MQFVNDQAQTLLTKVFTFIAASFGNAKDLIYRLLAKV